MENKATREFEELMDRMTLKLPAGLYFDNAAIECIGVMVTLKQLCDLTGMKKKELYPLYLEYAKRMFDGEAESIFTEKGFKEFLKAWPEVLECPPVQSA